MCFSPSPPKDNSADIARQQEEARQGRITQGKNSIDQAFAQFDDPYYSGITKSYEDYYDPQLEKQYNDTLEGLTYKLARGGNAQSSTADKQFGDLLDEYNKQREAVSNQAIAAANTAKSNVQNQKTNLYNLNTSSADPSLAASNAAAAATNLSAPPTFSPLGNLFAGFLQSAGNSAALANQNGANNSFDNLPTFNFSSGGSGNVVK